jgi:segregation and condensation protein A
VAGIERSGHGETTLEPLALGTFAAGEQSLSAGAHGAAAVGRAEEAGTGFTVHLEVFEGPFDLLLSLIARHKLDVTLVALSQVTDDFLASLRRAGWQESLERTSEFLVVAATLLDLKVARLLPSRQEDEEDIALLEARDLLFARLLQYRAFREVADILAERWEREAGRYPRQVGVDPALAGVLPDVVVGVAPEEFAAIAAAALRPRPAPVVDVEHIHMSPVSVEDQAAVLRVRLRRALSLTFRALRADCQSMAEVIARFLALLDLYREDLVAFDQLAPFAELLVRWTGGPDETAGATGRASASTG